MILPTSEDILKNPSIDPKLFHRYKKVLNGFCRKLSYLQTQGKELGKFPEKALLYFNKLPKDYMDNETKWFLSSLELESNGSELETDWELYIYEGDEDGTDNHSSLYPVSACQSRGKEENSGTLVG